MVDLIELECFILNAKRRIQDDAEHDAPRDLVDAIALLERLLKQARAMRPSEN